MNYSVLKNVIEINPTDETALATGTKILFYYEILEKNIINSSIKLGYEIFIETNNTGIKAYELNSTHFTAKFLNTPKGTENIIDTTRNYYFHDSRTENYTRIAGKPVTGITFTNISGTFESISILIEVDAASLKYLDENGSEAEISMVNWSLPATLLNIPNIVQCVVIQEAPDFDETQNPTIRFTSGRYFHPEEIEKVEVCLSITGGNDDIPYRNIGYIPISEVYYYYTFELSEEDKVLLYPITKNALSGTIRFYAKTTYLDGTVAWHFLDRTYSITSGYEPTLTATIKDINPVTLALTGNENTLIKYCSNAQFDITAQGNKGAEIVDYYAANGSKVIKNTSSGVIEGIEDSVFYLGCTDSRGYMLEPNALEVNTIDYIKLTCNQKIQMELVDENTTTARVTIRGYYYNDYIGAVKNDIKLEIRHTEPDTGELSAWQDVTIFASDLTQTSYSATFNLTGFDGGTAYEFQCRATDKLVTAETEIYTARLTPVFDWSEDDFNFNVPVTIQGNSVYSMHILSDTTTADVVELTDSIDNYEYIEIFYSDNNGRTGGVAKFPVMSDNTITVSLSLTEASAANATYIRRTSYLCKGNTLTPVLSAAGYMHFTADAVTHQTGTNYINVTRVVGYR